MNKGKQYRYTPFEDRSDDNGVPMIAGYFAVFDELYEIAPGVFECFDPHAFDKSLQEDTGDIRCLWNHDTSMVLGRTGNETLAFNPDNHGLYARALINMKDSDAVNARERVKRGDVTQCSIGFQPTKEEIVQDGDRTIVVVREARLLEVSPVTFPAYKTTYIEARAREVQDIRRQQFRKWRAEQLRRLKQWR